VVWQCSVSVWRNPGFTTLQVAEISLFDPRSGALFSGNTMYDSRLFDELPGFDIPSCVNTVSRLCPLPVSSWCAGHDHCFKGARLRELCHAYLSRRRSPTATGHLAVPTAIRPTDAAVRNNPVILTVVSRSPENTRASTTVPAG
jgi:hypothetical protein